MQKNEVFLRFGQIIRIHGHKCLQNQTAIQQQLPKTREQRKSRVELDQQQRKNQIRGIIAVKGFTDKDAKYLTFKHFKNCQFYRQTLFQILPRGSFQKAENQQQQTKKIESYKQLCKEKMGQFVKFGQDVVFKHVDSLDFLSGSVRCSDGGLGAFKVQLSDQLLINLVFKLYPFRSFEKEGDKIKLQSPLRIKNISNRCYISTQKNQNKYSIVTTYSQAFTWLIHLHQIHQTLNNIDQVRTHDILYLAHTKNDGFLCIDQKKDPSEKGACIKLPIQKTGYECFTCLWQIEKFLVPKISPYEQSDKANRGTDGTYSLRQILTGQYLQINNLMPGNVNENIDPKQVTIISAKGLPNVDDYLKHLGLVKIGGPKNTKDGQIDAGDQIIVSKQSLIYRQASNFQMNQVRFTDSESQHGFRIIKIDEESKRQVLFIISTYQVLDQFSEELTKSTLQFQKTVKAKKIDMIDLTLQKLIAFIKNCTLKDIESEVLPNKKKQFICMDLQICVKLFKILKQMGTKILEQIYKTSKVQNQAFKTAFNRAYYLIWQIIKNNPTTKIYVCQSWLDIILDHAIQNQQQTVHETLNEILQSNQLVVTKFLKANNNHLVQRIIDIFTLKPPHQKFLNIFRASCMSNSSPIVGNQKLILTIFFKQLDQVSKFRFLTSMRPRIIMQGDPQIPQNNQLKIEKIYIQCYISKDHLQRRTLKEFFQDSSRLDLSQTSNYFISYLNLLADICYGRNTQAKKYVQQILVPQNAVGMAEEGEGDVYLTSLDTLISILQDEQMKTVKGSNNLLRAAIRLINYAYVQSADQNPVLRINRYRNLDNMERERVKVQPKFKNVMKFIKDQLSNFQSFYSIVINDSDPDKKQKQMISLQEKMLMLTVLELLKSTLVIGYWQVREQQNQLLPLLLNILSNQKKDILHHKQDIDNGDKQIVEFEKFKKEVSLSTPSVELIVKCKALACQLIEIIFDFRHDNLVTECVWFYKEKQSQKLDNILEHGDKVSLQLDLTKPKSNIQSHPLYNPHLWMQQMQDIFKDSTDPQAQKARNATKLMNPLMVQLSIHKNPVLFFRSLKIMKRHFEYRIDILKLLLSLSIYDNNNGVELAGQINQKRKILGKLEQQNLLYSNSAGVYDQIMSFLVWLSQSIKQGTNLSIKPNFKNYVNIFCHFTQQARINKFHQRLIKNKDLHPVLLKFIGLSKQPLSQFKGDARLVLKYVYRFLALLAKTFNEAKSQMIHMQDKIFNHVQQECKNITDKLCKKMQLPQMYEVIDEQYFLINARLSRGDFRKDDIDTLQDRDDCQAIQLLSELYSHNKHIIYNQVQMQNMSNEVSEMVNTVPINTYYKSHLLNFFRTLIYYKDKHIAVNQGRILAKLQDSKKKNIYYRIDKADPTQKGFSVRELSELVDKFEQQNPILRKLSESESPYPLKKNEDKPIIIQPNLTYYITMMNLFANLVEGQHTVNIGKCRQVHSYSQLMQIQKNGLLCYPLKTHLRNYVNQLYYSTKIEEDLCSEIIKMQIPLIIDDLNTLIVILSKNREGKFCIVHPVRYKFFDTYIYLYIEQIVYSLNYLLQDETFKKQIIKELANDYSRGYYYLHYYIMRIYERLRWLLNYYYQHKYMRGFLNKITNKMKETFLMEFKESMFRVFDRNQEKNHAPKDYDPNKIRPKKQINQIRVAALKKRSKDLMHKLVKGQIGNYFTVQRPQKQKNFPLTFCLPYGDQSQNQQNVESSNRQQQLSKIAQKLKIMLFSKQDSRHKKDYHHLRLTKLQQSLSQNVDFLLFMSKFKLDQCNQLYEVDKHSKNYYDFEEKFVSFQEYIKIFVKVNTQTPQSISNDLKIFFFQVLLQFITRFKTFDKQKPIDCWKKQDWDGCKSKVIDSQYFLNKANVAELIIQTLKNSDDIKLSSHVLLFGIGYLIGGNTECQNSILQKLRDDTKNDVFIKIQTIISRLGKKIASRISERTNAVPPKRDEFIVQSLDLYDYYDDRVRAMKRSVNQQKTSKDQKDQEQIQKYVFSRLFKFLQLLCQCNNFQLKHFVRVQTNKDGSKKNYSFNVINMTTFQIRRLFKVMSEDASKIILPLTDFLNEVVTVPCIQNQISLCQTTFFEDLCYMASFFKQQANLKERGFDTVQSLQRLFQTYQKCILIILNVLQGNDPQLNKQLLVKLDVTFLLGVIQKNFQILGIKTKQDLHTLLYDMTKQNEKVPVELQNAINVMIVLEKLQASDGSDKFRQKKKAYLIQLFKGKGFNLEDLLKALREEMLKIEVVSSSKKPQYIYFPKHPILTKLSGATRDRIMIEVSRSTQRQKIKSLFSFKEQIFTEIHHNFKIEKQKILGVSFQPSKIAKLQDYSFNISYLIIILWFFTTDIIVQYNEVIYYIPLFMRPVLTGLGIIQLLVTLVYFLSYFRCKFQLAKFRAKKHEQKLKQEQQRLKQQNIHPGQQGDQLTEEQKKKNQAKPSISTKIKELIINTMTNSSLWIIIKFDEKFFYVLLYLITSIFGTFQSQNAYLFYILFYFMENETLSNVFNAIVYNLKQLFSVGLLGVVFVYIFCLIFYQTYALDLMSEKDSDESCSGIIGCIMDLYVSGTIGGSVQEFQVLRFATDLIYFIFFGLLFGNIVSGIMIDTFAQLRAKRQQMNDDKKNRCYICGKDRATLQKSNQNFDQHINGKHFLWNYIYYMYCLNTKPETQFSGLEYQIRVCIESGQNQEAYISWIPFNTESDDVHGQKIQELKTIIKEVTEQSKVKINSLKSSSTTSSTQVQATQ